ncbi:MAG: hypothetical protein AAF211_26605, partial [Myxococcota bacterium]
TLRALAGDIPWRLTSLEPVVLFLGFGDSSVNWEISVWGGDPWRLPQLRTDLGQRVWDALKAADITIAYPQVDVHFDASPEDGLRIASEPKARESAGSS